MAAVAAVAFLFVHIDGYLKGLLLQWHVYKGYLAGQGSLAVALRGVVSAALRRQAQFRVLDRGSGNPNAFRRLDGGASIGWMEAHNRGVSRGDVTDDMWGRIHQEPSSARA
jgi:hypothetical protein